jgi:hypothetical protein
MRLSSVLLLLLVVISASHGKRPRPPLNVFYVQPTVGQPWPKPQSSETGPQQLAVQPSAFHFLVNSTSQTCDILTSAFDRYYRLIFFPHSYLKHILNPDSVDNEKPFQPRKRSADLHDTPLLKRLNVHIQQPCDQFPSLESDESCKRIRIESFFFPKSILFFLKIDLLSILIMVCLKQFQFGVLFVVLRHSVNLFIPMMTLGYILLESFLLLIYIYLF